MWNHSSSDTLDNKGSFVDKLSLHDSSLGAMFTKLGVAWAGVFAGITLSDLFTLLSIVYVALNIFVLARDKIIKRAAKKAAEDSARGDLGDQ